MSSLILLLGLLVFVGVSSGAPSARDQIRIVGGTESAQGKWPFFAGLFYNPEVYQSDPYCGAVIWDQYTLITAAHCILFNQNQLQTDFVIYMGYISFAEPKDKEYLFKAIEVIPHPDYRFGAVHDDIALIRLDRGIDFDDSNRKVQCVCDPEPLNLLDTSACVTMGWGRDNEKNIPKTLQEVVLPILDNAICEHQSSNYDPNYHLCAGYVGTKVGNCIGDSGGPLVCPQKADPAKYSLVGIASYGSTPPDCGMRPGYFTNVELYLEWIAQVLAQKTPPVQTPPQMSSSFWQRWFGKSGTGKWW